jgi:hypothetical protein
MSSGRAPKKNPNRRRGELALELAVHAAMGAAMGLSFCLVLLVTGQQDLANMIAHNSEPRLAALLLVSFVSLIFAAGATLTGMVLMTWEEKT